MSVKDHHLFHTGSETSSSVAARDSPPVTTASVASTSSTMANVMKANINDIDHPPDRTLWLGDLEAWMDDHYMVQVCSLFGWDTNTIYIPRPPAAPNATRHPNNAGYCLLVFTSHSIAAQIVEQYGPDSMIKNELSQPILLPNSNRPIKLDWLNSSAATMSIGKDPGPIDNAIEYSIFVGDIASDVTNADLMNVFRNPNLGLRGDFPPRLIAPFLSCCNAKVMVDSVTGISKGYGFVRFTNEADQKRALVEMQGLYCKSRPMRLSTATAKNKVTSTEEEHTETIPVVVKVPTSSITSPSKGPIPPRHIDPLKIRSITTAVAENTAPRPSPTSSQQRIDAFSPAMLAKIAQLSNTMGQHYPAYRSGGPFLPPPGLSNAQIQQWLIANPQAKSHLETVLGGSGSMNGNSSPGGNESTGGGSGTSNAGVAPSDPMNTTVFVGGLSPLISEETLRTFFAPFGGIHYVKVPPGKSCGFVQFVKKADAERAIEALSGFSIGGSKVRLSWGRIPAAQTAAQAAAAAAAQSSNNANHTGSHQHPPHARSAPSSQGTGHSFTPSHGQNSYNSSHGQGSPSEGPLSNEQALGIMERLVLPGASAPNANPIHGQAANSGSGAPLTSHGAYGVPPTPLGTGTGAMTAGSGGIPAMSGIQTRTPGPPPPQMTNYRDTYPYQNGSNLPPHFVPPSPAPYLSRSHMGSDYGRNDFYLDTPLGLPNSIPGYNTGLPYNAAGAGGLYGTGVGAGGAGGGLAPYVSMSPALGHVPVGGGGFNTAGVNPGLLDDQILGYGNGMQRLHNPNLRQGGANGGGASAGSTSYGAYGPVGAGISTPYMGMGMGGGGGYSSEYDLDLGVGGGYRSSLASGSFGVPPIGGGIGAPGPYGTFSPHGLPTFGNGDLADRFLGPMRSPYMTGGGGGGGGGIGVLGYGHTPNGFTLSPPGLASSESATGSSSGNGGSASVGGGGTSPYNFGDDGSPHFQAADILRQDSSGLGSYLSTTPGPSSANPSAASSGTRSTSTHNGANVAGAGATSSTGGVGVKTNGHVHGVHELTGMFSTLAVVTGGAATGAASTTSSASTGTGVPSAIKNPISPTKGSAGAVFGTVQAQGHQHFRNESNRY